MMTESMCPLKKYLSVLLFTRVYKSTNQMPFSFVYLKRLSKSISQLVKLKTIS